MWQAWLRTDNKYELVNVENGYIVNKSGMTSKSLSVVTSFVDYIQYGVRGNLPSYLCRDLDYISSRGSNYCPCHIKLPLV